MCWRPNPPDFYGIEKQAAGWTHLLKLPLEHPVIKYWTYYQAFLVEAGMVCHRTFFLLIYCDHTYSRLINIQEKSK